METMYGARLWGMAMNYYNNTINTGSLWQLNKTWWLTGAEQPTDRGSIVIVIELEPVAGNVRYLLEEQMLRMDVESFLIQFRKITE